jgi:hypothetical protein
VWQALPARFETLGQTCRRLCWETADIRAFVTDSLRRASGTWTAGVVGAVGEFAAMGGAPVQVEVEGGQVIAHTAGGRLRFWINDDVRALTFDAIDTPPERQRVVLAVKRGRGHPPPVQTLTDLGADGAAIDQEDRALRLFDLGLGRKEARFCVRCAPGPALEAVSAADGAFPQHLSAIGPALLAESPARVIETALGRLEILTPIPPPGGTSPLGPHTHLLPDHLATGRAMPAGMDLPRAYLPGAIFYPAA